MDKNANKLLDKAKRNRKLRIFTVLLPSLNFQRKLANRMYFDISAQRWANRNSTNDYKHPLNTKLWATCHCFAIISTRERRAPRGKEFGQSYGIETCTNRKPKHDFHCLTKSCTDIHANINQSRTRYDVTGYFRSAFTEVRKKCRLRQNGLSEDHKKLYTVMRDSQLHIFTWYDAASYFWSAAKCNYCM